MAWVEGPRGPEGERSHRWGRAGAELPLVLLPGVEGSSRALLGLSALGRRRQLWAVDLPRRGADLREMAELLRPRLPAGPFLVFGASLGGLLGWALSERLPVLGLVTLGSLPARRFLPVGVERAPERLERLPRPLFRLVYRLRIRGRLLEEGLSGALVEELLADLPERDALVARLRAIRAWGLPPAPACPALWLRPQHDREAPWSVAEAAEALPGLGAETVPGGHRAWLTHPGPLVDLLEHFFRPWSAWPDRGAGVTRG